MAKNSNLHQAKKNKNDELFFPKSYFSTSHLGNYMYI